LPGTSILPHLNLIKNKMVTKCVCFNKTFRELKSAAEQHGCNTIAELKKYVIFSENCRLCEPYVKKMLETGLTEFSVLS
jgi:NAD(P)H-nitrite reductase large subunit